MAKYKHADVDQYQMINLNLGDLFPQGHPTHRLLEIIDKLDLSFFDENYTNDKGGRPAFPVNRLLAILIYSLLHGNISMRNLERDLHQRADLLFLSGGLHIDHSSISVFRKRHSEAIEELFSQTVFLGSEAGLIDFETVCIDSTKIKANANRADIGTREELQKRYKYVQASCKKRYAQWAASEDTAEQELLQKKISRLERQEKRIAQGLEFLQERKERKRVHLTDKDADWHRDSGKGFVVGYNAHVAVDAKSKMITHHKVAKEQSDTTHTVSLVEQSDERKEVVKAKRKEQTKYVLDAGYSSEANLEKLQDKDLYMPDKEYANKSGSKVKPEYRKEHKSNDYPDFEFRYDEADNTYVCPENNKLHFVGKKEVANVLYKRYKAKRSACISCALKVGCIGHRYQKEIWVQDGQTLDRKFVADKRSSRKGPRLSSPHILRMREKLQSAEGRRSYALRFPIVEGTIGIIKEIRKANQFLRRGLERVQTEWTERCIAHNIGKMIEFSRA